MTDREKLEEAQETIKLLQDMIITLRMEIDRLKAQFNAGKEAKSIQTKH